MPRTLLFSGFDVQVPAIPDDARVLLPPIPLPPLEDFTAQLGRALAEPLTGESLPQRLGHGRRLAIVVDDPTLPVPPVTRDCRREMLQAVARAAASAGARDVTVLVANGLSRQWRPAELSKLFGPALTAELKVASHDAEASERLVRLGQEPEGPVEFERTLAEADLVVHLNVVTMPLMAGLFGIARGATGYRTARFLGAPQMFEGAVNPLSPGSAYHRAHERVAAHLARKVPVFQVSAVLNNELWAPALAALLRAPHGLSRPLQVWNALPAAVRRRAARLLEASYRPIAVFAGPPEAVAPRALEAFYRQHELTAESDADVLVFGLPDQGPGSVHSSQNPVLAAHLALGYVANLHSGRPLLRQGGVLVFANPLTPEFDRRVHLPHAEFYERVLRQDREPLAIQERYEASFAGRPELVAGYQRRFAFHGAHPLHAWYQCTPARRLAGRILVAHGDPRACARLGFSPAADVEDALEKARDFLGKPQPAITVLELPPPFWVRAR